MSSLELSPANFRELARNTVELAADYLETLDARPIFPPTSGEETERLFRTPLPENGLGERAFDALGSLIDHSRAHNGRFFGYVHGSGEPVAWCSGWRRPSDVRSFPAVSPAEAHPPT